MKICIGVSTQQDLINPAMGSEVAAMGLARSLARRGHKIDVVNLLWDAPRPGHDIYHWFNAHGPKGPYLSFARFAHSQGKPCFATPIWWPLSSGEMRLFKSMAPESISEWLERRALYDRSLAAACAETDALLPNSTTEGKVFESFLRENGVEPRPWVVVPNAVDRDGILRAREGSLKWKDRKARIISVGRVEPAKNQHNLARAFSLFRGNAKGDDDNAVCWNKDAELVLCGEISSMVISQLINYFLQPGVSLTGRLLQSEAFKEMSRSRVHALLGVHETPGLTTLEAAALGCQLVVSIPEFGTIGDYLEGLITVDPLDPASILEGLTEAMETAPDPTWADRVLEEFSYQRIAELAEEAYKELGTHRGG